MQRSYRQFQMERALPSLEARVTKLEVSPSSCKFAVAAHAGVYWWVDELGCSSRWSGRCRAWGHASQSWRGGIGALALCHPASRPCAWSACTSCTHVPGPMSSCMAGCGSCAECQSPSTASYLFPCALQAERDAIAIEQEDKVREFLALRCVGADLAAVCTHPTPATGCGKRTASLIVCAQLAVMFGTVHRCPSPGAHSMWSSRAGVVHPAMRALQLTHPACPFVF